MGISLFGWLDNVPIWRNLPYPIKGALLRALKAGAAGVVGVLLAAAVGGTLLPIGTSPAIIIVVTMGLQALDKFLRERKDAQEPDVTVEEGPGVDNGAPNAPTNADTDKTVVEDTPTEDLTNVGD